MTFVWPADGPGQSEYLTHFCGRAAHEGGLTPEDRLASLCWSGELRGARTYRQWRPSISLSESRLEGLAYLIRDKHFAPWGIVTTRSAVWGAGGGPVWYARQDQIQSVPEELKIWTVPVVPGKAEWMHEREWRIPTDWWVPAPGDIKMLIVGDPTWRPRRDDMQMNPLTHQVERVSLVPPLLAKVPRLHWDPVYSGFRTPLLPPFEDEWQGVL